MSHIIVTGSTYGTLGGPVNTLPQRLEWHTFVLNQDFVTLYVYALQQFQQESQSSFPSYFQICGIHGLPPTPWDNDPDQKPDNGYCNHGINTFPPWHRPYVALYEQRLAELMQPIAQSFTDTIVQARMVAAAAQWRLPYWDWALYQSIPDEFANQSIQVLSNPDGEKMVSVNNPFYAYKFHPIDPSFSSLGNNPNYEAWQTTLRQPTSTTSPRAKSQEDVANSQLAGEDFKQLVLDLFPTTLFEPDPWGQFSNHSWNSIPGDQGTLTSLEGIHDMVHVDVGGAGHMGNVPVAAFDPIFWLHHCQVDRLFCLWQAVYPTVYVSPGPDAAQDGSDVDVNTPLLPFWKTQSDFANSADCQSTGAYGYTYPEIASAGAVSPDQLSTIVHNTIDQLYGDGSVFNSFRENIAVPMKTDMAVNSLSMGVSRMAIQPTTAAAGKPSSTGSTAAVAAAAGVPGAAVVGNTLRIPAAPTVHDATSDVVKPPGGPGPVKLPPHELGPGPVKQPGYYPPGKSIDLGPIHLPLHFPHIFGYHAKPSDSPSDYITGKYYDGEDYIVTPETYRDWVANITIEKYALGTSGRICFFMVGDESSIPSNPYEWHTSPYYVGSFSIFATPPHNTGCKNCEKQAIAHTRIGGTVHLTKCMIRNHVPLTGDVPVEYLRKNLHWRVCTVKGVEIAREEVGSLKVVVQEGGYEVPAGVVGGRPVRTGWIRHSPITRGRLGGVDHEGDF